MAEPQKPVEMMTEDELRSEVTALRAILEGARATISRQSTTIDNLQAQAKRYFRAASDYVPPVEREYD